MSGLCGWIGFGTDETESRRVLEGMAAQLAVHPHEHARAELGQAMALAVAALAGGSDIACAPHVLCAVYGRPRWIDRDLAQSARRSGLARSIIDTYQRRGAALLDLLHGPFAIALVRSDECEAFLAVDRIGVCSITYVAERGCLMFGSSADAINCHPLVRPTLYAQGLYNYVYFHMVPGPDTVYQGQKRLLPGSFLRYRDGRLNLQRYWEIHYPEQAKPLSDLKREFLAVLRNSVAIAASGTETGSFLSGGTDSSTVAGLLTELKGEPARTYSIGFPADGYDEMDYARAAARHFGTRHHEYYVTPADVAAAIPRVGGAYDQPFGNASAVPTYYCARLAKSDGIQTMLGGDGGDELFGGNARYATQYLFSLYQHVPAILREGLLEPVLRHLPLGDRVALIRRARSYVEQASLPMPARLESYNLVDRLGSRTVFRADFLASVDTAQPLAGLTEAYDRAQAQSTLNRMLALDLKYTLADSDLPKVTRMCEIAGVEAAYPMLDEDVVEFSARLPSALKLKGTRLRYFFKEALRDFLPSEILTKQKHGFGLPFGLWLRSHKQLADLAYDSLGDLKRRRIIRADFIDELLSVHVQAHAPYYGTMVWVLMMLEQWFKLHHDRSGRACMPVTNPAEPRPSAATRDRAGGAGGSG